MNSQYIDSCERQARLEVERWLYGIEGSSIVDKVIGKYLSEFSAITQLVIDIVSDNEQARFIDGHGDRAWRMIDTASRQLTRATAFYLGTLQGRPAIDVFPNPDKPYVWADPRDYSKLSEPEPEPEPEPIPASWYGHVKLAGRQPRNYGAQAKSQLGGN